MKRMLVALLWCCALMQAGAADVNWMTDLPKALEKAKAENKLVLMDFTGSDWCSWCIKLNQEVFSKPDFTQYASENLVPVEVDFPSKKPQSAALKKANKQLQAKYKIEGYPTVVVLDSNGKELGRLGYQPGGPKAFITELEKLKGK